MRFLTIRLLAILLITPLMLWVVATAVAPAQEQQEDAANHPKIAPTPVQIVALDECDPTTFNVALGPDFCKNVAIAFAAPFATTFQELFKEAKEGHPDKSWDFDPDTVTITKGTSLIVVNQGGEPHTFTEVAKFGGGFIAPLNHGEEIVPECAGGFKVIAVARTRILQGSQLQVAGLSKGEHLFECCIHPWMRVRVEVK
jgi:plastocyanin